MIEISPYNNEYCLQHKRLKRKYGKAVSCWNTKCKKKSTRYDWANISGKYLTGVPDWWQLCRSCHFIYDFGDYANHPDLLSAKIVIDKTKDGVLL